MMPVISSKDTIVTLRQLHPPLLDYVFPLIFYYKLEHTFVLDKILFAQALTNTPHLSMSGIFGTVYEHILGCFILKDPFFLGFWNYSKLMLQLPVGVSLGQWP
jgi:hypothetical protein